MGLGLSGAFGARAAQEALRQIQQDAIAEGLRQKALEQQGVENEFRNRQLSDMETDTELKRLDLALKMRPGEPELVQVRQPDGSLVFQRKVEGLTSMPEAPAPKYGFVRQPDGSERYEALTPGLTQAPPARTPKDPTYIWRTNADGSQTRVIDSAGVTSAAPPSQQPQATSPYQAERGRRTIADVDALMGQVGYDTTGVGSILARLPATSARNFQAQLDTLKANIAFSELTAMREASKTGGALGAISDKEIGLLSSALGALDAGQSPAAFRQQLQKVKDSILRWQKAMGIVKDEPPPGGVGTGRASGAGGAGQVERWGRDANGNPIRIGGGG